MKTDLEVLISLHDVMPDTFPRMEEILRYLKDHRIPPITLLVVPGLKWKTRQIQRLQQLSREGYPLAAHGWKHRTLRISRPYHRLHAATISRNVAEHLSLNSSEILDLMKRSSRWFEDNDLPTPSLYVPPAWALGKLENHHLSEVPYTAIEVLRGIIHPADGSLSKLPMVGFEADTRWREFWVRIWNKRQLNLAKNQKLPLRIGIHPKDFSLRMAEPLRSLLNQEFCPVGYDTLPS